MKDDGNGSFLQLSHKTCGSIYEGILENGKSLLSAGEKCAVDGKYGLAISLSILGIGESIKGAFIFAKSQGVLLERLKELKKAITADHETRHETVALFELIVMGRTIFASLKDPKETIGKFLKNPIPAIENFFRASAKPAAFDNIDWWINANEKKNNGFYSRYEDRLLLPSDTTKEEYEMCRTAVSSALNSIDSIFKLFREERDLPGLVKKINSVLDFVNEHRQNAARNE